MSTNFLIFIYVLFIFHLCICNQVEESSTGAIISFPYLESGHPLYNITFEVSASSFGFTDYGGYIEGIIVLPANTTYHTECIMEPLQSNVYIHSLKDFTGNDPDLAYILLIDSLSGTQRYQHDCSGYRKVLNAQTLGASGAIVLSFNDDITSMEGTDSQTSSIDIPSVKLSYTNALILMNALGVINWNPDYINSTIYPDVYDFNWTYVKIEWGLPHLDDRVEWELMTSAFDFDSIDFKANFKDTAIMLNEANDTLFTPHYVISNSSIFECESGYNDELCKKMCTNQERYCFKAWHNYQAFNGSKVIQETLRQLCIWQYVINITNHYNDSIWWNYVVLFDYYCFNTNNITQTYTQECSYTQMSKVLPNATLINYVNQCIIDSGGYGPNDGNNTLLEKALNDYMSNDLTESDIIVNNIEVKGDTSCEIITVETCAVLDAICYGFINNTQPDICYVTPAPTVVNCSINYRDCSGECYGNKIYDKCNQCIEINNDSYNYCVGCDDNAWSNKAYNPCGYCINITLTNFDDYGKDCNGTCEGSYESDQCGNCLLPSDSKWNDCVGCDGIAWSNKTTDCKEQCGGNAIEINCENGVYLCLDANDPNFETLCDSYQNDSSSSLFNDTTKIIMLITIIILIILIISIFIICKLWKKQKHTDQRFSSLMKQYEMLDEIPKRESIQ